MHRPCFILIFLLSSARLLSQINMEDSTVQVITYWEKGEKQSYTVTTEKIKVRDADTASREKTTYDVDVTVKSASDKSYTIEWAYKNITSNSTNETIQKIMKITNDMKVVFSTDELGMFTEVVNWKEVKDYIQKACETLRKDFKSVPEMDNIIKQIEATYSTKEAIESASIKDIQQFHSFHGAKYKLGEVLQGQIKVPNIYGTEPFDSEFTVFLDEINPDENTYVLRSSQEVDKEQLTNATFDYLTRMAKNMSAALPKREDLGELKNETLTASRIHSSGWVTYSIQTTTITSDDLSNIEERIIALK